MPSTPELKTIKPITFLFHRTETMLADLINHVPVGQQLFKEAVDKNLDIAGPVHWHYFGFEGEQQKPFTLEIALPVRNAIPDYDGPFHFKRTENFMCACLTHEGRWDEIPKSYDVLMAFIAKQGRTAQTISREIYVQADFDNQEANVTEIQIGVH
jgi:effector-binding domain-containing protein